MTPDWVKESSGWVYHNDETPWWLVDLPQGGAAEIWFRLTHICRTHTIGVHGWEVTEYCRCGAHRFGEVAFWASGLAWNPASGFPQVADRGKWLDRNARYLGTAMHYETHLRPVQEGGRP